jgi:E3 ubiquitin-protein ligase UBR7
MFQCLGVGSHLEGGCGEDWYHPECLLGLGENWEANSKLADDKYITDSKKDDEIKSANKGQDISHADQTDAEEDDEAPLPPGFPSEESFDGFICYQCVEANPWLKRYAGAPGFLPPVYFKLDSESHEPVVDTDTGVAENITQISSSLKRKADDVDSAEIASVSIDSKRVKKEVSEKESNDKIEGESPTTCKLSNLARFPSGIFSLFFSEGFRSELCKCKTCWTRIAQYPQLQDEESIYEPSVSEDSANGASTLGSGSLYERGESALKNMDRVRAIEGVMAYNLMKEQLKPFFEKFAGTGKAISADDIKDYFAKLRGDDQAIKSASQAAEESRSGRDSDHRREQGGY